MNPADKAIDMVFSLQDENRELKRENRELKRENRKLQQLNADMLAALEQSPDLPAGFMDDMDQQEKLEWLMTFAEWWQGIRNPAIAKARGDE